MTAVTDLLRAAAVYGRWLLVAGLLAGALLPSFADTVRGVLPELVALLLFLAALRIGPRNAIGATGDLGSSLGFVAITQIGCPLIYVGVLLITGWSGPLALALALMFAAPPIAGSPNLTQLLGHGGAPALRVLIAGTVLLPVTVIPTFWHLPELAVGGIAIPVLRLLLLIAGAGALAFLVRGLVFKMPTDGALRALDGASAIVLALLVIGLMSAVGPAITERPLYLAGNLLAAFAVNFSMQIAVYRILRRTVLAPQAVGLAVAAGNRNISLFLAALPVSVTEPMLVFIGCYQVPMYLTPLLLSRFYRG